MTSTEKETSHGGDATTVPNVDTLEDSHCMYCWLMQANQPAKEVEEINRLCYFWTMLENDLRDEIVNEVGRQGDKWEDEIGEGTHGIDGHSMSLLAVLEHMCHDHSYDNIWKTHESSILEQVKNLYDGGSYESEWEVVEKGECAHKELCSDIRQAYERAVAKVNAHPTAFSSKVQTICEMHEHAKDHEYVGEVETASVYKKIATDLRKSIENEKYRDESNLREITEKYEAMLQLEKLLASSTSQQTTDSISTQSGMVTYTKTVYVFGSNLAGIHGAGTAREACLRHGASYVKNVTARWGVVGKNGSGLQGNGTLWCYAIPTKDEYLKILPLDRVRPYVEEFVRFAVAHPDYEFNVTKIGCGLARPPYQTIDERIQDIRSLFESVQFDPPMEESAPDSGWTGPNVTIHDFPNINLPIEFGGGKTPARRVGEECKN